MKLEPDIICYNVDWEGIDKVRILAVNKSTETCRIRSIECPWTYSTPISALYETEQEANKAFENMKKGFISDISKGIDSPQSFLQFMYDGMASESIPDELKKEFVKNKVKEYFKINLK